MDRKNKKLNIAFVSDAIYPYNKGGKEKRIFEVSTRLAKKGHRVTIYCMKWWKGKNTRVENGVILDAISPLYPLYSGERRSIKQAILFALSLFKLLKSDFDVVDADHMPHLVLFPLKIVCVLKRKKLIVTWNEVWGRKYWVDYLGFLGNIAYVIEKISAMMPNLVISISKHTSYKFKNELNSNKRITTIPMGIDLSEINTIKPSIVKTDVIFAGRLLKHKNADLLIGAVEIISKKKSNILCLIVGEGPEKNKLVELVKKLNLEKNVKFQDFLPHHKDLYSLMKSSKVFVLPSTREGFGIVALEANACGIPVVTTNHKDNAAKDLINGANGALVGLKEVELASAINELLNKANSNKCVDFAKNYDWETIASKTEEVYLAKKSIIVTTSWDDGHKLDLKLANLLRKYNIGATFYISPLNHELENKDLLTESDIKKLSKDFEIGAHTLMHPNLTALSHQEAFSEIAKSKKCLEKITGKEITAFCYPYGKYNTPIVKTVKKAGFKLARITKRFEYSVGNPFELATSTHAYSHLSDLVNPNIIYKYKTNNWEVLAKKQFNYVLENGGVFHLWGHSWEINKNKGWRKLENVLSFIGNRRDVEYITNSGLIK